MNLEQIYNHYNSLNPFAMISKNTPGNNIMTVSYSQFKTISQFPEAKIRLAEFKKKAYVNFMELAKIVGNNNIVIRLGHKEGYFEVYDTMCINLDEDKINQIADLFVKHGLIEDGFKLMVVTFILPKKEEEVEPEKLVTMMFKFCPKTENADEFFGYIL